MPYKMVKKWEKSPGLCWMCQNKGVTAWFVGPGAAAPPSGWCGPCHRAGYYELVWVKE